MNISIPSRIREGDACLADFSSRKPEIVVYIADGFESREKLLQQLGTHRTGKVCVYIKRLSDIDVAVLEKHACAVSSVSMVCDNNF